MTDLDTSSTAAVEAPTTVYEVFNADYSVGVACNRSGRIVGLHLGTETLDHQDDWLANEILRVAELAYLKSRVGRRTELQSTGGAPGLADSLRLITEAEYQLRAKTEFGQGI